MHCWAVENYQMYTVTDYGHLKREDETQTATSMVRRMQEEIHAHGPVTCALYLSTEFTEYTDGILTASDAASDVVHYVNVMGWDATDGTKCDSTV